ncbi:MAG: hypothetical protein ACE5RI_05625 [Candidatus Nitrosomaritimum yanchengensis]
MIAKFTALNKPPITKRNKKIFTIDLFRGLRVSDGRTARSVILRPYRNPTAMAGTNIRLIRIGDSLFILSIWGKNIKNNKIANEAAVTNNTRFI